MSRHLLRGHSLRTSGRIRAILAAGTVLGLGAVVTFASFSDNAQMDTTFTVGSVVIGLDKDGTSTKDYTFSDFSGKDMKGGEAVYAQLIVRNDGTLPFTYTMSKPAAAEGDSSALADTMTAGIRVTSKCGEEGYAAASDTNGAKPETDGAFKDLSITTPQQIAAKSTQVLCFKAQLPDNAPNTIQGAKINPTFTFTANQLAN